jgi:chaperonin cofactor prefoldin
MGMLHSIRQRQDAMKKRIKGSKASNVVALGRLWLQLEELDQQIDSLNLKSKRHQQKLRRIQLQLHDALERKAGFAS